ncbi:unnamed protein product [Heterosigma akashiwo]|mmetsp:Transcript_16471/g.22627  ORF Transcript_16471/g.22627 Transcript_16471/m.22627 type:complete len:184 (-) Transcript_16471:285-836(-)
MFSKKTEKKPLVGGEKKDNFYFVQSGATDQSINSDVYYDDVTPNPSSGSNSRWWWPFGGGGGGAITVERPRKVPIKIEPKVFFANERTFLAWMHMTVTLASIAVAIIAFGSQNEWSQVYGLLILPVAICFCLYALYNFLRRASLIRRRAPGPYEDTFGPTFLATILMVSILLNFAVKLYSLYG